MSARSSLQQQKTREAQIGTDMTNASPPPHYTPFGWVDDDANFRELVAMNPTALENAIKMRQDNVSNAKPLLKNSALLTTIRPLPALPVPPSSYVASAGAATVAATGKKSKNNEKKKSKLTSKK